MDKTDVSIYIFRVHLGTPFNAPTSTRVSYMVCVNIYVCKLFCNTSKIQDVF